MELKPHVVAEINLKACKKIDSKVTKVVDKASHVVMYELVGGSEWKLKDVEGSLFIVKRSVPLLHYPLGRRTAGRPITPSTPSTPSLPVSGLLAS